MRKSRFTEAQMISAIKQSQAGLLVDHICKELGISRATFYNWKKRYTGRKDTDLNRLKILEKENKRLREIIVELNLVKSILKDVKHEQLLQWQQKN